MVTNNTIILLPVFNDWQAFQRLADEFEKKFPDEVKKHLELLVVNDGSYECFPSGWQSSLHLSIINLTHNIGHQKAITIGLSYIYHHKKCNQILVMDSDGDDTPEEALNLLETAEKNPDKIIIGQRTVRQESIWRRFLYTMYLTMFKILTGQSIRFGNFCLLPFQWIKPLIYKGDTWLHLPGGIIKSKIEYISVPTRKGIRYHGKSKMSLMSLFYHGISALAAFIDIIAIRLLLLSGIAIAVSILGLLGVLLIKLTTNLAIPGWASLLGSLIIVIILISFLIALFLIFTFLSSQSSRKLIPAIHYKEFIENVKTYEA